ncbi:PP2C family protein-serine/threonine phosphatase [Leifsonia poae]|uniref:PP2C family protein-serine/threonine phosphatase n=1 Tax=Leifsonia poae TaxID=110933 RepID=UPI003D673043
MFGFVTGQFSTSGDFREGNEDSLYASHWSAFVADGVGGHAGGEVASATVTIRIAATLDATRGRIDSDEKLRELIAIANADLALRARLDTSLTGMATTFTGIFSDGERIRVAHVGDSRAYLLRDGEFRQVTRDDSFVQDLLDAGELTTDEAKVHPYRSVVMNVLGGDLEDAAALHILNEVPQVGDRWLLASDGLTDYVPEHIVRACLASRARPQDVAQLLVETATDMRARDNVTVVVADVISLAGEPAYKPAFGGSAALDPASTRTL